MRFCDTAEASDREALLKQAPGLVAVFIVTTDLKPVAKRRCRLKPGSRDELQLPQMRALRWTEYIVPFSGGIVVSFGWNSGYPYSERGSCHVFNEGLSGHVVGVPTSGTSVPRAE